MDTRLKYFLAVIFALVLLAIGAYIWRSDQMTYVTPDTPEAAVHNYLLAVQRKDAAMLHSLLFPGEATPSQLEIVATLENGEISLNSSIRIAGSQLLGEDALVTLEFWQGGGLFDGGYGYQETARLRRIDGRWYIVQMPYPLWSWNWGKEGVLYP